jgi:acetyl-CoA carboxylase alpha subunit
MMAERVAKTLLTHLSQLEELPTAELLARRDQKYRKMGVTSEPNSPAL